MLSWTDPVRFAFQPVVSLVTGSVAALEVLARPETHGVLAAARRSAAVDSELAVLGLQSAVRQDTLLPLHLNLFAATLAEPDAVTPLRKAVRDAGRRPSEITVDVGPPFTTAPPPALLAGVAALRGDGFRISADGVGEGDLPLALLADLAPDIVKLDRTLTAALPDGDIRREATVRAARRLCDGLGALLVAEGVETEREFTAARDAGVQLAQGHLFAPPARRVAAAVHFPAEAPTPATAPPADPGGGPPVTEFLRPAALLPRSASAEEVRELLTAAPDASGVLLTDDCGVPELAIDRNRFLLSLSSRYGHALYADRPAARLADDARTVGTDATAWSVLEVVAADERARTADDVAVTDDAGRCVGVVRLADIVRALAESRVEEAAALNPLTRLPGSDTVSAEVARRAGQRRAFALSWLDVDGFKAVNDGAGFAAGDELIRAVGRTLGAAAAAREGCRVGHIGGDDFLLLCAPEELDGLAAAVLDVPWSAGGSPVTLSLATVVCGPGSVPGHREAAECLAPLKKAAKALDGASWVLGRPDTHEHQVLRAGRDGTNTSTSLTVPHQR